MNMLQTGILSRGEQLRRHLIAAALIAVFMFNPGLPVWLTLVACYPFITALVKLDPLNAVLEKAAAKLRETALSLRQGNQGVPAA